MVATRPSIIQRIARITARKERNIKRLVLKNAIWCGGEKDAGGQGVPWTYETEIPHESFMIYVGGEPYCRGIVFSIADVE